MTDHAQTPAEPYARPQPKPRRYSRPRPSLARYVLAIAAVAIVGAIALWGGLAAQMSSGGDPVLGETATATSNPSAISAPVSDDEGGAIEGDDLEEDDLGAVVIGATVDQAPAPVSTATAPAPAPAPVQTSTS